jgi:hypothetical protein
MPRVPPLRENVIRRISEIVGKTSTDLTGTQIARMLAQTRIPDPGEMTKRECVYQALGAAIPFRTSTFSRAGSRPFRPQEVLRTFPWVTLFRSP